MIPPDVGLAPSAAWRPPPSTPLRPGTPSPPTSLGRPLPEPCKKRQGEEGRRGQEGKGFQPFGLREGSSNYNGGWGGTSKHQLGPDPHLGAPKKWTSMKRSNFLNSRAFYTVVSKGIFQISPWSWNPLCGNPFGSCRKSDFGHWPIDKNPSWTHFH